MSISQEYVEKITSWERGKTVIIVCSMNAIGNYVLPLIIFPKEKNGHRSHERYTSRVLGFYDQPGYIHCVAEALCKICQTACEEKVPSFA